jgi:hypothetical protein
MYYFLLCCFNHSTPAPIRTESYLSNQSRKVSQYLIIRLLSNIGIGIALEPVVNDRQRKRLYLTQHNSYVVILDRESCLYSAYSRHTVTVPQDATEESKVSESKNGDVYNSR